MLNARRAAINHPQVNFGSISYNYVTSNACTTSYSKLRLVMDGGIFVPTMSLGNAPAVEAQVTEPVGDESAYQTLPSFERLGLTPRQADVLSMLLQGKPNKDIARRMGLSVETVKDHVQAVLRALGVSSRTQAVLAVGQMTRQRRAPAAE